MSIGNVKYDSKSKKVIWNIGKASVGNYTLNLILKSIVAARNNVTPLLTTSTYDESVAFGVPTRYLTVKSFAKLIGNKNIVKYFQANSKYQVRVIGENGKIVGEGIKVKMSISSKTYIVKTDKNGWAKLNINFKAGKYTVKVTYKKLKVFNKINRMTTEKSLYNHVKSELF